MARRPPSSTASPTARASAVRMQPSSPLNNAGAALGVRCVRRDAQKPPRAARTDLDAAESPAESPSPVSTLIEHRKEGSSSIVSTGTTPATSLNDVGGEHVGEESHAVDKGKPHSHDVQVMRITRPSVAIPLRYHVDAAAEQVCPSLVSSTIGIGVGLAATHYRYQATQHRNTRLSLPLLQSSTSPPTSRPHIATHAFPTRSTYDSEDQGSPRRLTSASSATTPSLRSNCPGSTHRVNFAPSVRIASRPAPRSAGRGGAGAKRLAQQQGKADAASEVGGQAYSAERQERSGSDNGTRSLSNGGRNHFVGALRRHAQRTEYSRHTSTSCPRSAPSSDQAQVMRQGPSFIFAPLHPDRPHGTPLDTQRGEDAQLLSPAPLVTPALPEELPRPPASFIPGTLIMLRKDWQDERQETDPHEGAQETTEDREVQRADGKAGDSSHSPTEQQDSNSLVGTERIPFSPNTVDELTAVSSRASQRPSDNHWQAGLSIYENDRSAACVPRKSRGQARCSMTTDPVLVLWEGSTPTVQETRSKSEMPGKVAAVLAKHITKVFRARLPPTESSPGDLMEERAVRDHRGRGEASKDMQEGMRLGC